MEPVQITQPDANSCKLDDIKRLLAANLDLVQSVLKVNEGRADCCSTEALIAALRKDNETMRQSVLDMNTKEWNRLKQFNSLTRRLRFYFDKSHELREGIIVSRSTIVSIEQAIVKLGVRKRGTLVDTVRFLANYYVEHNGPNDAPPGAPQPQPPGTKRKAGAGADSSDSDSDAGEMDCLSEVGMRPGGSGKRHKGPPLPPACDGPAGRQPQEGGAPGHYPFAYNYDAADKIELDASVCGEGGRAGVV